MVVMLGENKISVERNSYNVNGRTCLTACYLYSGYSFIPGAYFNSFSKNLVDVKLKENEILIEDNVKTRSLISLLIEEKIISELIHTIEYLSENKSKTFLIYELLI